MQMEEGLNFIGQRSRPCPIKWKLLRAKGKRCPSQEQGWTFEMKVTQQLHWC